MLILIWGTSKHRFSTLKALYSVYKIAFIYFIAEDSWLVCWLKWFGAQNAFGSQLIHCISDSVITKQIMPDTLNIMWICWPKVVKCCQRAERICIIMLWILSITAPVQLIAWKNSSLLCWVGCNELHSLAYLCLIAFSTHRPTTWAVGRGSLISNTATWERILTALWTWRVATKAHLQIWFSLLGELGDNTSSGQKCFRWISRIAAPPNYLRVVAAESARWRNSIANDKSRARRDSIGDLARGKSTLWRVCGDVISDGNIGIAWMVQL